MSKFDKNNKREWEENPNKKREKSEFEKNREMRGMKQHEKKNKYGHEEFETLEDRDPDRSGFSKGYEEKPKGFEQGKEGKNKDQGFGKKRKSA